MDTYNEIMSKEKAWLAVYTRPQHEKSIHRDLVDKGVEVFLPLQKCLREWSDRRKWVEVPLFRCYLFVKIRLKEHYTVLNTSGVVRFIRIGNEVVEVPEKQIIAVKKFINHPDIVQVTEEKLEQGDRIEIVSGPFMGIRGELVSFKGKKRVAIKLESIGKSLVVDISTALLKKVD
jgi:transcriptional antiterminator RfaH